MIGCANYMVWRDGRRSRWEGAEDVPYGAGYVHESSRVPGEHLQRKYEKKRLSLNGRVSCSSGSPLQ